MMNESETKEVIGGILAIVLWVACFAAYIQHLVTTWANDMLLTFIVGALLFPVGVIHGVLIWLGVVAS